MNKRSKPQEMAEAMTDTPVDAAVEVATTAADAGRARLAETLTLLADRLAPAQAMGAATDVAAELVSVGGGALRRLSETARANPVAAALAATGVIWLAAGAWSVRRSRAAAPRIEPHQEVSRWEDEGGNVTDHPVPDADDWTPAADGLYRRLRADLARLDVSVRDAASAASERATVLAAFGRDMAAVLGKGLEDLPDAVRDKVQAAREAAVAARMRAEDGLRAATGTARRAVEQQPLLMTAGALALGALAASLLPRGKAADAPATPGADNLLAEARRILADERARLSRLG